MSDKQREIRSYFLTLKVQAPNMIHVEKLEVERIEETEPIEVNILGVIYHRYGDELDYVDLRPDDIVIRSVRPVYVDVELPNKDDGGPKALVQTEKGEISV